MSQLEGSWREGVRRKPAISATNPGGQHGPCTNSGHWRVGGMSLPRTRRNSCPTPFVSPAPLRHSCPPFDSPAPLRQSCPLRHSCEGRNPEGRSGWGNPTTNPRRIPDSPTPTVGPIRDTPPPCHHPLPPTPRPPLPSPHATRTHALQTAPRPHGSHLGTRRVRLMKTGNCFNTAECSCLRFVAAMRHRQYKAIARTRFPQLRRARTTRVSPATPARENNRPKRRPAPATAAQRHRRQRVRWDDRSVWLSLRSLTRYNGATP